LIACGFFANRLVRTGKALCTHTRHVPAHRFRAASELQCLDTAQTRTSWLGNPNYGIIVPLPAVPIVSGQTLTIRPVHDTDGLCFRKFFERVAILLIADGDFSHLAHSGAA
jgi:cytochrome c